MKFGYATLVKEGNITNEVIPIHSKDDYKLPWRVVTNKICKEWEEGSGMVYLVSANNLLVCSLPQHTSHPGIKDHISLQLAQTIISSVVGES